MDAFTRYFAATARELKQVSWPTQQQASFFTLLVIIISIVVALYVGAFDYIFSEGMKLLIERV